MTTFGCHPSHIITAFLKHFSLIFMFVLKTKTVVYYSMYVFTMLYRTLSTA